MFDSRPARIAIDHDDYHAEHIGHTADGSQFLLTTPFTPGRDNDEGQEYVALYLFDSNGRLTEAKIDAVGTRATMDRDARRALYQARLLELGDVTFGRIEIALFTVERFDTVFGLIAREPEDDDDDWWVILEPGDYMAFHPPWDSGEYDT